MKLFRALVAASALLHAACCITVKQDFKTGWRDASSPHPAKSAPAKKSTLSVDELIAQGYAPIGVLVYEEDGYLADYDRLFSERAAKRGADLYVPLERTLVKHGTIVRKEVWMSDYENASAFSGTPGYVETTTDTKVTKVDVYFYRAEMYRHDPAGAERAKAALFEARRPQVAYDAVERSVGDPKRLAAALAAPDAKLIGASKLNSLFWNNVSTAKLEAVQLLLAAGADVNYAPAGKFSPILLAASAGRADLVTLFLDRQATRSPYLAGIAAEKGHRNVLEVLAARGDSLDDPSLVATCARSGRTDLVGWILSRHPASERANRASRALADRQPDSTDWRTFASILLRHGADPNYQTSTGEFALLHVARAGQLEAVAVLCNAGADPNLQAKDGSTAYGEANRYYHNAVAAELGAFGAKGGEIAGLCYVIEKKDAARTRDVLSKRFPDRAERAKAASIGLQRVRTPAIFDILRAAGADPNYATPNGRTALIESAYGATPEMIRKLLAAGAQVNAHDNEKKTALWMAVLGKNVAAATALLDAGADPNLYDKQPWKESPLDTAVRQKDQPMIDLLRSRGALSGKSKP